jgi:hypothetical protein
MEFHDPIPPRIRECHDREGHDSIAPQADRHGPMHPRGRAALQRRVELPKKETGFSPGGSPHLASFAKGGIPPPHPSEDLEIATTGKGRDSVVPQATKKWNRATGPASRLALAPPRGGAFDRRDDLTLVPASDWCPDLP